MRLDIQSQNRIGITQEVLAVFAQNAVDVRAVDMVTHHIYVDAPDITDEVLTRLSPTLLEIDGIDRIRKTAVLPSERRRAQLAAVFATITEPLLAVDRRGDVLLANRSAVSVFGFDSEEKLKGQALSRLISADIADALVGRQFQGDDVEIQVRGESFLVHATPFGLDARRRTLPLGGVLMLQTPARLGRIVAALQYHGENSFEAIIGQSPVMQRVKERAARIASINAPLLIFGETGTGKELFARACHAASERNDKPLIALNCAALPESLAEAELFGYESGAFTNAVKGGKPGLLELADGGSVFLDEISELTPYLQAKLLRFLQDGSYRRIGGEAEKNLDVRIISATNRDLTEMAASGEFRDDLLFRLNVLNVETPPLRERREDIPLLATSFARRATLRIGRGPVAISEGAMQRLLDRNWPGNVRELENVMFRSISLLDGAVLRSRDLLFDRTNQALDATVADVDGTHQTYATALAAFERTYFQRLASLNLSTRQLAERIGVSHTTVARKLRVYCRSESDENAHRQDR